MSAFPPGPPPHRRREVLRNARSIRQIVRDPIAFVGGRFSEHGDTYHVDEGGGSHLYVTRDADIIREVLVERAGDFVKAGGANDRLKPMLGNGLLTSDGETWKRQRTLIQPRFHHKAIASYGRIMREHVEAIEWADGEVVDVSDAMMRLTLRIVCKALFDQQIESDADTIAGAMDALRRASQLSILPDWFPTPARIRARRAVKRIDTLIEALIDERKRDGLREDLLSMLLDVGLERQLVRDNVVTLFLAGHETTSHALSWTWWLLANHPEAAARLHAEVDAGGDDPRELPYTAAVASEAMRLYPPVFVVARVASRPTRLGEWDLEPGAQVLSWIWHCHHQAAYFEDPEAFRPERFLEPAFPKHAYLPFGAGTRMCIGTGFAKMELVILLASLARRYALAALPGQTVEGQARVTYAPRGGLPLRVSRRAP